MFWVLPKEVGVRLEAVDEDDLVHLALAMTANYSPLTSSLASEINKHHCKITAFIKLFITCLSLN